MVQNSLLPNGADKYVNKPLLVILLGFDTVEEERLRRMFLADRPDARKYIATNPEQNSPANIMMVNFDNAAALIEKDRLLKTHPHLQTVAITRGPLNDAPPHHVRGMLIAARVLSVLDKVVIESVYGNASLPPSPQKPPLIHPAVVAPLEVHQEGMGYAPISSNEDTAIGFRALVVDDSLAIQKSLELYLSTLPQIKAIDFADSGESALEKTDSQHYDLIFLDIMMPGMDGYETCSRIRKKPTYKKTPIIMVSGKTSPLDEVKGVVAGCTTYLTKPVQPEAFQKLSVRVLSWLEKQAKA